MPGKIAGEVLTQQRELDLLLDIPIIGLRWMAIEHQASGGPDVDEIGRNPEAVRIVNPPVREVRRRVIGNVDDEQHKAHVE